MSETIPAPIRARYTIIKAFHSAAVHAGPWSECDACHQAMADTVRDLTANTAPLAGKSMIPELKMPDGKPTQEEFAQLGAWMQAMHRERGKVVGILNQSYADMISSTMSAFISQGDNA